MNHAKIKVISSGSDRMYLNRKKRLAASTDRGRCITGSVLLCAGLSLMCISRISRTFAHWYSTRIYPIWVNVPEDL